MGNSPPPPKVYSLHVLKVSPYSPGLSAGLEPFLDFIQSVQSFESPVPRVFMRTSESPEALAEFYKLISENVGRKLELIVYNVYSQCSRKTIIVPSRDWNAADSLLGVLVRVEDVRAALEKSFRVISVLNDSPAERSGLIPQTDYILGLTYTKYEDIHHFKEILLSADEPIKELCVFNEKKCETRHILIQPDYEKGLIGCEFGFGIKNQLKPGLENVESSKEPSLLAAFEEKNSPKQEKNKLKKDNSLSVEKNKKTKAPPQNPLKKLPFERRPSGVVEDQERDFLEIEFSGIPKYDLPPKRGEIPVLVLKKQEPLEVKSNNSSFLIGNLLESEHSVEKTEGEDMASSRMKKLIRQFTFFAKRINMDYVIREDELFRLDLEIGELR